MVDLDHPDRDALLLIAEGDEDATKSHAAHVSTCDDCLDELARLRGFLEAIGDEILASRPGCLNSDELADIPLGGESEYEHLTHCPLCREELGMIRELAAERSRVAGSGSGIVISPGLIQPEGVPRYASGTRSIETDLHDGATVKGRIAGTPVSLDVASAEIIVRLDGEPDHPVVLVLSDGLIEQRIGLESGEMRIPLAGWNHAKFEKKSE